MKRVLVPLDGTKDAEAALPWLSEVCAGDDEIVLLSVKRREATQRRGSRPGERVEQAISEPGGGVADAVSPDLPTYAESGTQTLQRQLDETTDYLEGLASGLRDEGFIVHTDVLISDRPGEAIIDYARQLKPSFLIMVRRTHSFAERIFGSVSENILKADVAPVLFVPPPGATKA
jgi:nucleotide-binding universal stress UspA family protein